MLEAKKNAKSPVSILFLGGVGDDVTGSSTLIAIDIDGKKRFGLVDIGGFQGKGERNQFFPVKAEILEFIIVTHAHYDHIGLLPKLYKDGFKGNVFITKKAKVLGKDILDDAAQINVINSECRFFNKKDIEKEKHYYEVKKAKATSCRDIRSIDDAISQMDDFLSSALYNSDDVKGCESLYHFVELNELTDILDGKVFVKMLSNPHQEGAIELEFYYKDDDGNLGVFFSGDIGNSKSLLYQERNNCLKNPDIDYLIMESLHGTDIPMQTLPESIGIFEKTIKNGLKKGKRVIVNLFSLDRYAMAVYLINKMFDISGRFKVYLDAPLGLLELSHYQTFYEEERSNNFSKNESWFKNLGNAPFDTSRFEVIKKRAKHTELLNSNEPCVILTSSANGNGGRVVDFFDKYIQDSNTIFVIAGYVYEGSPSRILLDTSDGEIVDLGERRYIKHCETLQLHGFTSHGYFDDFLMIVNRFENKKLIFLNHGELLPKKGIKKKYAEIDSCPTVIPSLYDSYTLSKTGARKLSKEEESAIFGEVLIESNMDTILEEIRFFAEDKS